jgi:uncharacterized membrane protein
LRRGPCRHRICIRPALAATIGMKARIKRLSTSNRRKLTSILLAVVIFGLLTVLTTLALGRNPIYGVLNAIMVGTSVGLFEQFYVQNARGRWFRSIHPLKSMLIYTGIVAVVFILSIHLVRLIFWHFDDLPWVYRRLPVLVPIVITFSVIGIVVMRVAHFVTRDPVSPDDRHLSPPGGRREGADVPRHQQFDRARRAAGRDRDQVVCR